MFGLFSKKGKMGIPQKESKNGFDHIPGFSEFLQVGQKDANQVNLLKKNKKIDTSETSFTTGAILF